MKTHKLLLPFILVLCSVQVFGWGYKGHYIVAEIAERNLTPKAKAEVDRLLNGKKMVFYADWLDNVRNDKEGRYDYTRTWHYANVDSGKTFEEMPVVETGNVLSGSEMAVKILTSATESDSLKTLYLKYLVHLVGDLHCPMHAGRLSDRGGNSYHIKWFNSETNIHSLWDSKFLESARFWSYSEWATNLMAGLTPEQIADKQQGAFQDWFLETVDLAAFLYEITPQGENLSYAYIHNYGYILEQQFTLGGLRLAQVLNTIFD
ncbi:MAG: S1/P1 nuclease [Bacteroidales bacterium]|jgi:hypothetical protein|nr:S1/P1 nuclease [Bacteroidales bacterium]